MTHEKNQMVIYWDASRILGKALKGRFLIEGLHRRIRRNAIPLLPTLCCSIFCNLEGSFLDISNEND